jgi:hypothetical protein
MPKISEQKGIRMTKLNLKILILFSSIALVLSINGCDLIAKKAKSNPTANKEISNQASAQNPIADNAKKNSIPGDNNAPIDPPKKTSFAYTRENPFLPLISEQSPNAVKPAPQKIVDEKEKKPEPPKIEKPVREVMVSLNGVISGDSAFFSEDGLSKTLSVGETIAGMKILEINKGEVILIKDNLRYRMKTGEQLKVKVP